MSSSQLAEPNDLFLGSSDPEFELDADVDPEYEPNESDAESTPTFDGDDDDVAPAQAESESPHDLKRKASSQGTPSWERGAPVQRLDQGREAATTPALFKSKLADKLDKLNGIKLVDLMLEHGIAHEISLPRIAIVGNQSSGKSSVIEAITGVSLPRAKGTCTRCPIEVRLICEDVEWSCQVTLRLGANDKETIEELPFGEALSDSTKVEGRLHRAQIALLRIEGGEEYRKAIKYALCEEEPSRPPKQKFTPNSICVTIRDRNVVNLSFVDVPGLISNAGTNSNQNDVQLVEAMVKKTISSPDCLILLTISCCDDIQNQSGAALAREADPSGKRTIGVLTKTDLIQKDDHDVWLALLKGEKEQLAYGYYAVRNPGTEKLNQGIPHAQARASEAAFFKEKPWSGLPPRVKSRLGTGNLAGKLSSILEAFIQKRIPAMAQNVSKKLKETEDRLKELPPAIEPEQAVSFVVKRCTDFASAIHAATQGVGGDGASPFLEEVRTEVLEGFREAVENAAPVFKMTEEPSEGETQEEPIVSEKSDEKHWLTSQTDCKVDCEYSLSEICALIKKVRGIRLPGNVPYDLKLRLIRESMNSIPGHVQTAFQKMKELTEDLFKMALLQHFELYQQSGFYAAVNDICTELREKHETKTQALLEDMWECQKSFVFTNNNVTYNQIHAGSLLDFRKERPPQSKDGKDPYEEEINLCADVSAYWWTAFERIVDVFPSIMVVHFLQAIGDNLHSALGDALGIYSEDGRARCIDLLKPDDSVVAERTELLARKTRLEKGLKEMREVGVA